MEASASPAARRRSHQHSLRTSLIAAFIAAFLILFLVGGGGGTPLTMAAGLFFGLLGGAVTFLILRTGKVNTARLALFLGTGLFFGVGFSLDHQLNRGSILLTSNQFAANNVPICPITVPFVIPSFLIRGEMIFPATVAALVSITVIWLGFVLLFGRGWCSWLCFFGGIDQACATVLKRPLIKWEKLGRWGRLFPYAFLLFLILIALAALFPLYCAWLCPLRIVYDPPSVNTTTEWASAVIFVAGGTVLLVGGPLLTKKRLYCGLVCPLLPANAIVGKISPFKVKIDREKCTDCGACTRTCEVFAMTEEAVARGEANMECSRCGKCMDICPQGAIDYRLIGTRIGIRPIFITLAVVFSLLLMSGYVLALIGFLQTGQIHLLGQ